MADSTGFKLTVVHILVLVGVCAVASFVKLHFIGISPSNDYYEYLSTAKGIAHVPGGEINRARILKPLNPLMVSVIGRATGFETGLIVQAVLMYGALTIAMYVLAREFLRDGTLALLAALMVSLSYPVLKYGIEGYSETGAWFFFIVALWLTLRFVREPVLHTFMFACAVVTVGFLWKEYAIVAGIILAVITLAHPALSVRSKALYSVIGVGIFGAVHVPWQLYVQYAYDFNYFKWSETSRVGFSVEFTLKNVTKSLAAVLGLAWLLVPLGIRTHGVFESWQRRFVFTAAPVPFISFLWGYISSRTFYVIGPPMMLLAVHGMRSWSRTAQYTFVATVIAGNVAWLFLSYSIKL